jgi:hypothetical protein
MFMSVLRKSSFAECILSIPKQFLLRKYTYKFENTNSNLIFLQQKTTSYLPHKPCEIHIFPKILVKVCLVQKNSLSLQCLHTEASLADGANEGGDLYIGKALSCFVFACFDT